MPTDPLEGRVRELEKWRQAQTTVQAVDREKRKHMDEQFAELKVAFGGRFDQLDGHISKRFWLGVASSLGGMTAFVTSGGLNVGG